MYHSYRIARMLKREWPAVQDLDVACFPCDARDDLQSDYLWWVARMRPSGKVVAYAGGYLWEPNAALVLCRAGVSGRHRRRGLQCRLLQARIAYARRQGLAEVITYTSHTNIPSNNNLIRCGFKLWHPTHWGGYKDVMRTSGGHGWLYWRRKL